jgi:hypothetical protein
VNSRSRLIFLLGDAFQSFGPKHPNALMGDALVRFPYWQDAETERLCYEAAIKVLEADMKALNDKRVSQANMVAGEVRQPITASVNASFPAGRLG